MDELKIAATVILSKMMEKDPCYSRPPDAPQRQQDDLENFNLAKISRYYWKLLKVLEETAPQ